MLWNGYNALYRLYQTVHDIYDIMWYLCPWRSSRSSHPFMTRTFTHHITALSWGNSILDSYQKKRNGHIYPLYTQSNSLHYLFFLLTANLLKSNIQYIEFYILPAKQWTVYSQEVVHLLMRFHDRYGLPQSWIELLCNIIVIIRH